MPATPAYTAQAPSLPPAGALLTQGLQLAALGARFLFGHVASERIGTLLNLESELKRDDRLPKDKGFGGVTGLVQQLYSTDGVSGMTRGVVPSALYQAGKQGLRYLLGSDAARTLLNPQSSASAPVTEQLARLALVPLASGALLWPLRALYNVIQSNYMGDIVARKAVDVSADPAAAQERETYQYTGLTDTINTILRRVGWTGVLLHSGWEAYIAKRYLLYATYVLPGLLSRLFGGKLPAQLTQGANASWLGVGRKLAYLAAAYPLVNVMLRMARMSVSQENDARAWGAQRYTSVMDCVRKVIADEGWTGLYSGFAYNILVKAVLDFAQKAIGQRLTAGQ